MEFEVAIGQAARDGSLPGWASIRGGVSSVIPSIWMDRHWSSHVVLLEQDGADQPSDAGLVGKDADHVGARLTSLFKRSNGLVECDLVRCRAGKVMSASTSCSLSSISVASLGQRGRS